MVHPQSQIPLWIKDYHDEFYKSITAKENWCYTNLFTLPTPIPPAPDPLPDGYVDPEPGPPTTQLGIEGYKSYFTRLGDAMNAWKNTNYQSTVLDVVSLSTSLFTVSSMHGMIDAPNPHGSSTKDILAECDAYQIFNMAGFIPATLTRNSALPPFNHTLVVGALPTSGIDLATPDSPPTITVPAVWFSTDLSSIEFPNNLPLGVTYESAGNKFVLDINTWINKNPFTTPMKEVVKYGIKTGEAIVWHTATIEVTDIGHIRRTLETRGDDFYNDIDDTGVSVLMEQAILSINGNIDIGKGELKKSTLYLALQTLGTKGAFEPPKENAPANIEKAKKIFIDMHYKKVYDHLNIHTTINSAVPPGVVDIVPDSMKSSVGTRILLGAYYAGSN